MVKAKFGDSLRSKSDTGQVHEALCKIFGAQPLCPLLRDAQVGSVANPVQVTSLGSWLRKSLKERRFPGDAKSQKIPSRQGTLPEGRRSGKAARSSDALQEEVG
jgi:hypothetical protein